VDALFSGRRSAPVAEDQTPIGTRFSVQRNDPAALPLDHRDKSV
jgi:hypothetical protein